MGTSTSSSGPGPRVLFDPPWLDQIGDEQPDTETPELGPADGESEGGDVPLQQPITEKPMSVAPDRRFVNARRQLNNFARTGSRESLGKAIGHYSRTGMGGAGKLAHRMRVSTKSAANLMSFLQTVREDSDLSISQWVNSLTGQNVAAQNVIDEIIRHVTSAGGSREEESCRDSMDQAMAELLTVQPDIELLNMNDTDIWTVVELFLGNEAWNRLYADIGQKFESAELSLLEAVNRMKEMREYLMAEVSAQMYSLRSANPNPNSKDLESLMQEALKNTFLVYEGML